MIWPPFPARSPERVVEPVPPLETVRALEKVTVFVAVRLPAVNSPDIRALP